MSTRSCGHDSADSDSIYICLPCEAVSDQRMKDEEWNEAIEAAALKVAQYMSERWGLENTGTVMASEIRALKRERKASQRPPCDSCNERPRAAGLGVCDQCANDIYGRGRQAK